MSVFTLVVLQLCVSAIICSNYIQPLEFYQTPSLLSIEQLDNSNYSIDFTQAITTDPGDSVPANTDIGPCTCDLWYNLCDIGCSCDAECTATQKALFSFQLSHGPQSLSRLSCLDADTLSVNTAGSLDVSFVGNM
eukprot:308735_1